MSFQIKSDQWLKLLAILALALTLAACDTIAARATQDCGKVQMRGPNPPTDAAAQQAENCIWSAYQQKGNARLSVSIMGVDTVETHDITVADKNGQATITDMVEHTIVPARPMPSQTYTCSVLEQQQNGMLFKSCGDEGDFLVPAPENK